MERAGEEETSKVADAAAHEEGLRAAARKPSSTDTPIGLVTPEHTAGAKSGFAPAPAPSEFLRAANEDDDGYDPYSDRREEPPLFEPDPWR